MIYVYMQEVVTATVDLEDVRAYRNEFRSRTILVSVMQSVVSFLSLHAENILALSYILCCWWTSVLGKYTP